MLIVPAVQAWGGATPVHAYRNTHRPPSTLHSPLSTYLVLPARQEQPVGALILCEFFYLLIWESKHAVYLDSILLGL